ncbi:MAG: periplasmic heavy metal sensor [Bacteroidota bacterium]
MKTSIKFSYIFMALFFVAMSNLAFAQQEEARNRRPHHRMERGQEGRMIQIPNLSDTQQEQIKKLMTAHQKEVLPLRNEMGEKRARLKTLSTAQDADMKSINKVIDEIGALQTKLMKSKAAHHQEVRKVLDDEQRLWFDTHQREGRRHRRQHRG